MFLVVADEFHAEVGDDRSIGQPQEFKVKSSGSYLITAAGAKGGNYLPTGVKGGRGANKEAIFELQCGVVLTLIVGKSGGDTSQVYSGAGGGGGTFIR
jgi:hypothetical protein